MIKKSSVWHTYCAIFSILMIFILSGCGVDVDACIDDGICTSAEQGLGFCSDCAAIGKQIPSAKFIATGFDTFNYFPESNFVDTIGSASLIKDPISSELGVSDFEFALYTESVAPFFSPSAMTQILTPKVVVVLQEFGSQEDVESEIERIVDYYSLEKYNIAMSSKNGYVIYTGESSMSGKTSTGASFTSKRSVYMIESKNRLYIVIEENAPNSNILDQYIEKYAIVESDSQPPLTTPVCGNGIFETGEQCDFGSARNNGETRSQVTDGSFEAFVAPGYGVNKGFSTCSTSCQIIIDTASGGSCGDGIKQASEQCDFGENNGLDSSSSTSFSAFVNPTSGTATKYSCNPSTCELETETVTITVAAVCGDGVKQVTEQCDFGEGKNDGVARSWKIDGTFAASSGSLSYGQVVSYSTCSACAELVTGFQSGPKCGDGIVQSPQEECDGGDDCTAQCRRDTTFTNNFIMTEIEGFSPFRESQVSETDYRVVLSNLLSRTQYRFVTFARDSVEVKAEASAKTHVVMTEFVNESVASEYLGQTMQRLNDAGFNLATKPVNQKETFRGQSQQVLFDRTYTTPATISLFLSSNKVYAVISEQNIAHDAIVSAFVTQFGSAPAVGSYCVDHDAASGLLARFTRGRTELYAYATDRPATIPNITEDSCKSTTVLRENVCSGSSQTQVEVTCPAGCLNGACKVTARQPGNALQFNPSSANAFDINLTGYGLYTTRVIEWGSYSLGKPETRWAVLTVNGEVLNISQVGLYTIAGLEINVTFLNRAGTSDTYMENPRRLYLNLAHGPNHYNCADTDEANDPLIGGVVNINTPLRTPVNKLDECTTSNRIIQYSCSVSRMYTTTPFVSTTTTCPSGTVCTASQSGAFCRTV
jgi:hypothetical protein